MLKIQQFIHDNPDWMKILSGEPYWLKIKSLSGRYFMFNYDQIRTPMNDPMSHECRGLILDSMEDFKIVRKGFNRFFNYGEPNASSIDWKNASATIKEDGTLIFLSYYNDRWMWGTRQNFDIDEAEIKGNILLDSSVKTFGQIVDKFFFRHNFEDKVEHFLGKDLTICLELCSRFNRVVIDYPRPELYLLSIFRNFDGEEMPLDYLRTISSLLTVPIPEEYKMENPEDYSALIESFGLDHEGIVVRDSMNNRIKMKSKLYFDTHRSVTNGAMDLGTIVGLIRKNEQWEFLSYFPEYKDVFDKIKEKINEAMDEVKRIQSQASMEKELSRKDFALRHKDDPKSVLWFKALDGRLDEYVMEMPDEKFIGLFKLEI